MADDTSQKEIPSPSAAVESTECPLSAGQQTRNLILFSVNVGLIYLAAPVLYVGITQAALCEKFQADATVSNLPSTVYFSTTPLPILVAWYFPQVRFLRPVLVGCYSAAAIAGAAMTVTLLVPTPDFLVGPLETLARVFDVRFPPNWVIPAMNLHAAVLGCALGAANTFQWEVLGRGVAEKRRGQAFALAFGVGPLLAVLGSLVSQVILGGLDVAEWNFALLFGASVPIMALAAFSSTKFVIPPPAVEVSRQPFFSGVFGGLGEYLGYRLILLAAIAFVLVSSGYTIITNLTLYTEIATGEPAVQYAGYQNTLRFGFKVVAGLFLGWWLTKTNAKAGMLITGAFCLASVSWALVVPGAWYLLSFCLIGAGELMGVYYPNYIFSCSAKSHMRRNMAFTGMLNMALVFPPLLFGRIAASVGGAGEPSAVAASMVGSMGIPGGQGPFFASSTFIAGRMIRKLGFQYSFWTSIAIIVAALLLVLFALPARPRPRESDAEAEDHGLKATAQTTASTTLT